MNIDTLRLVENLGSHPGNKTPQPVADAENVPIGGCESRRSSHGAGKWAHRAVIGIGLRFVGASAGTLAFLFGAGGCAPCPISLGFAEASAKLDFDFEIPFHDDVPGLSLSFLRLECDGTPHQPASCAWKRATVWAIYDDADVPNPLRVKYGVLPKGMRLSGPDPKEATPLREGDVGEVFVIGPMQKRVGHNCRHESSFFIIRDGRFVKVDEAAARRAAHRSP